MLAGVPGKRGHALESEVARQCREAGGSVATNVLVKELDLVGVPAAHGKRLKVVFDGLPLHAGVPPRGRSAGIQSWWDVVPDHVSLFLAWRSAARPNVWFRGRFGQGNPVAQRL